MKYDVAVVGGGPAGLSAAQAAAKAGCKVVLFEREDSIAQYVRTSGVTWISEMRDLGIPARILQSSQKLLFYFTS